MSTPVPSLLRRLTQGRSSPSDPTAGQPFARGVGETRVYRGRSVEELVPRVQRELGEDAIVLRRREGLTGGIFGFFQRPFVELEATAGVARAVDVYDEDPSALRDTVEADAHVDEHLHAQAARNGTDPFAALLASAQEGPAQQLASEEPAALPAAALAADTAPPLPAAALAHLAVAPSLPAAGLEPVAVEPPVPPSGRTAAGIERKLMSVGISERFARELIETAATHLLPLSPGGGLASSVGTALALRIPMGSALPVRAPAIAFVGAGGSGKTSCCAALMGAYRKSGTLQASCAMLAWGSGEDGLQMLLAPHIRLPEPAGAKRSMAVLARARKQGIAIVDTPRVSPADRSAIRQLAHVLSEIEPDRVVAVLPATLSAAAAAQLLQALRPLKPAALAITHADETDQLGVAVETACAFGVAPEYLLDRARSGGWRMRLLEPASLAERLMS